MSNTDTDLCARLAANRARIRFHLRSTQSASNGHDQGKEQGTAPYWVAALAALANGGTPLESLLAWWKTLPLGRAIDVFATAAQGAFTPIVKRHPVRLMVGAALAGAAIAWIRPWRWVTASVAAATLLAAAAQLSPATRRGNGWSEFVDSLFRDQGAPKP